MSRKETGSYWGQDFEATARIPEAWQLSARSLICAANILWDQYEKVIFPKMNKGPIAPSEVDYFSLLPVMVLYGLAIENLIKGIMVASKDLFSANLEVISDKKLSNTYKTHDLKALLKLARVQISPDDEPLLQRLHWIIESGKYPVGTKPRSHQVNYLFQLPSDIRRIFAIMAMLEKEFAKRSPSAMPPIELRTLGLKEEIAERDGNGT